MASKTLGFAAQLQPYKRILGVLLRDTCVSVAISNPYHNLSEPVGAVMLRNGTQLPARSFARLLDSWHGDIAGTVLGTESQAPSPQQLTAQQAAAYAQIQEAVSKAAPGLPVHWYSGWDPSAPVSCRVADAGASSDAAASGSSSSSNASSGGGGGGGSEAAGAPTCSKGSLFLQHYLDGLGGLNTFG